MSTIDLAAVVHIKSDYESWEKLMLSHEDNQERVDAGKLLYGQVDEKTAIVLNFEMDQEAMARRAGNPEFAELIKNDVESHDFYVLQEMRPPS
jgi:hypothetical protein|tara:strand:+ start:207 stop:485 length:279 start_codon:yes stop_codon:yes gene_type:complete